MISTITVHDVFGRPWEILYRDATIGILPLPHDGEDHDEPVTFSRATWLRIVTGDPRAPAAGGETAWREDLRARAAAVTLPDVHVDEPAAGDEVPR